MNFGEHVELGDWNGQVLLTVHDYELLDFLEDHFGGLGVETAQVHPPGAAARYQLLFHASASKAAVLQALEGIGQDQIARIVAINNGPGSAGSGA
jgi:hypothetical protein